MSEPSAIDKGAVSLDVDGQTVVGTLLRPDYAARPWRMWRASDRRHVEGAPGPINWDVAAS